MRGPSASRLTRGMTSVYGIRDAPPRQRIDARLTGPLGRSAKSARLGLTTCSDDLARAPMTQTRWSLEIDALAAKFARCGRAARVTWPQVAYPEPPSEQRAARGGNGTNVPATVPRRPLSITFAFVATHNHFVLDRGGKVFKRSAPVIKLPEGASEDDHLRLLGVLNSSTACFWLKQNSHDKGSSGVDRGRARRRCVGELLRVHRHDVAGLPAADGPAAGAGRTLDSLAQELSAQQVAGADRVRASRRRGLLRGAEAAAGVPAGSDDRAAGGAGLGGLPRRTGCSTRS